MSDFVDRQIFKTNRDAESVEAWRAYMHDVYFKLDIKPCSNDFLAGELVNRRFADAGVSSFKADAQRVIRSRQAACDDAVESFCIVFPTRGLFSPRQLGHEFAAGDGEAYILNSAEPYEVDISQQAEMVCLTLPCD